MASIGLRLDHCTFWIEGAWAHCCAQHDAAYTAGVDRALADAQLQQCVEATGNPAMSVLMLIAVTIFGWLFYRRKQSQ